MKCWFHMEIRIFGNYTGAALYLLLHFNDGEWYFVSFFILMIIDVHADPQHPCWCPRDPFIRRAEKQCLPPWSITLIHSAHQTRESRDGKGSQAGALSLQLLLLLQLVPPVSSHPPVCVPSPQHGAVWVCCSSQHHLQGQESNVGKTLLLTPLSPENLHLNPQDSRNPSGLASLQRGAHTPGSLPQSLHGSFPLPRPH